MSDDELVRLELPQPLVQQATAFMHARTIAIWGHHEELTKGEPVQYGSGALLQVDDRRFLVTAYHVCELFLKDGWTFFVSGAEKLVPVDHTKVWHSEKLDIAMAPLSDAVWQAFAPQKRFARLSEVDGNDPTDDAGGIYCAFGYPSATTKTDHDAKEHRMVAQHVFALPYPKTKRASSDFDSVKHIAIGFLDDEYPHPRGMSGCGIWRVHQAGVDARRWSTDDIKLVAIEHTLGAGHDSLVGTRIGYVANLIKAHDRTLAAAMDLQWPKRARTSDERLVRR